MDEQRRELLLEFIRTRDIDDRIGTPVLLGDWLRERGLIEAGSEVAEDDVSAARRLRAALRSLFAANNEEAPDPRSGAVIAAVSRAAPLVVQAREDGSLTVEAGGTGVAHALGGLVGIAYEATLLGEFPRFKACRSCGFAYYDVSKNRSRRWCEMASCGSKEKARSYRARKKEQAG